VKDSVCVRKLVGEDSPQSCQIIQKSDREYEYEWVCWVHIMVTV
jgi:hypothetical protein